jgi:hypothetical protein
MTWVGGGAPLDHVEDVPKPSRKRRQGRFLVDASLVRCVPESSIRVYWRSRARYVVARSA